MSWLKAGNICRGSEESSAYLSKSSLQERTAPTAARCRFKASAQSQGLIPIWGGGVWGVVTDVANVFIGPKQKALRRRQMECMWKVTKFEWERGLLRSGWPREHLHQALLGPPHLWMTWNTVWMFARVRVQLVLDHRCYHTAAARVRCEKKTVFSFDLCRNNSQTEKTPVAKKKHRICFMAEEATAVKRGHSFFANISAFRKTCWRHSMSGTALQPPPALLQAQLYTNMA